MYRTGTLALLVVLAAAGWSEAQLPAGLRTTPATMPTVNQPTVRQQSTTLGTPSQNLGLTNGSVNLTTSPQTVPLQTGNPGLPVGLQVMPRQNPNIGMSPIMPIGSQANVPLRGPSNNFPITGSGQLPLISSPLGAQTQFQGGNAGVNSAFQARSLPTINQGLPVGLGSVQLPTVNRGLPTNLGGVATQTTSPRR